MVHLKDLQIYTNTHCNLKCVECMYHSQFEHIDVYSYFEFDHDITLTKSLFSFETAILIGGEPLLNKELPSFANKLKSSGCCQSVQINTNGILIESFDESLYKNVDRIVISKYPLQQKLEDKILSGIEYLKRFDHIKIEILNTNDFLRTTKLKKSDELITQKIWNNCTCGLNSKYGMNGTLYNGKFYRCVLSFMKPRFLNHMKVETDLVESNYISLTTDVSSDQFETFFMNKSPLDACYWCMGCNGTKVDHKQIKSIDELNISTDDHLDFNYQFIKDRDIKRS